MTTDAADSVVGLYQKHAGGWNARRGQTLFERPWLDAFLALLPADGGRVLDLGCGTGRPMAGHLIAQGCRVTGVDAAPAMIAEARRHFPGHDWITADLRALPPLEPFHGILAWHSSFHLTSDAQVALFSSLGRLCLPGSALMFTSGPHRGVAMGEIDGAPLYHASLDPAEYRDLLESQGFEILRHVENDPTCGGATIWLARRRPDAR